MSLITTDVGRIKTGFIALTQQIVVSVSIILNLDCVTQKDLFADAPVQ